MIDAMVDTDVNTYMDNAPDAETIAIWMRDGIPGLKALSDHQIMQDYHNYFISCIPKENLVDSDVCWKLWQKAQADLAIHKELAA